MVLIGALFLGMLFFVKDSFIAAGDTRATIAFVDLHEIFQVHPERQVAEFLLQQEAMALQEKMEEEILDLSSEEQQQVMEGYQQQLELYEQELIAGVLQEIEAMVATVAQKEQVEVVLEVSQLLYGGLDLTPKVIAFLEEE